MSFFFNWMSEIFNFLVFMVSGFIGNRPPCGFWWLQRRKTCRIKVGPHTLMVSSAAAWTIHTNIIWDGSTGYSYQHGLSDSKAPVTAMTSSGSHGRELFKSLIRMLKYISPELTWGRDVRRQGLSFISGARQWLYIDHRNWTFFFIGRSHKFKGGESKMSCDWSI